MLTEISMEPVQRSQLTEQVIERIKSYIEDNNLQSGAKLQGERDLAKTLGVSRNVTREAVRALQVTGILEIQPGNGIFVAEMGFEALANHFRFVIRRQQHQMQHLIETRLLFENGILELAAQRIKPCDIEQLEEAVQRIANARTSQEDVQAEIDFHSRLVSVTGNPILMEFSEFFARFFREVHQLSGSRFSQTETRLRDAQEHLKIVQALKEKNTKQAQMISAKSIRRWGEEVGVKKNKSHVGNKK